MIHHISMPANEPKHVAEVLAELMDGRCYPFIPVPDSFMAKVLKTDKNDLDVKRLDRLNCSFDFGFGGVIATHRVDRNCQHGVSRRVIAALFLGDFNHVAALVLAAMRAHAMRQFRLMAIRA